MSEVAAETTAAALVTASQAKTKKPRAPKRQDKPKKPSTHPPVNDMVVAAIKTLKERNGSSPQAIKKYIAANYKCDVAKLAPFLKKALKNGVEKGRFVRTKGSFKLTAEAKKAATEKKPKKKAAGEKKPKKTTGVKKPAGEKKAKKPADEKKAKVVGAKAAKKAGSVKNPAAPKQKATKPSKTAAKKPNTPKPKKATPAKK